MKREDITQKTIEEKERVYLTIDILSHMGHEIYMNEHESGLPLMAVDCGYIHILTDSLSLEDFLKRLKKVEGG